MHGIASKCLLYGLGVNFAHATNSRGSEVEESSGSNSIKLAAGHGLAGGIAFAHARFQSLRNCTYPPGDLVS